MVLHCSAISFLSRSKLYKLELKKTIQAYISCPDTVTSRQEFQLNGYETYFGDIQPSEYYWDFGDGGRAVGVNVKYSFTVPGKYNIKLGVTEEHGINEVPGKHCSYKSVIVLEQ